MPPCIRLPRGAEQGQRAAGHPAVAAGAERARPACLPSGRSSFSSRGDKPFGNVSHTKARLDALIARQRAEARLGRRVEPRASNRRPTTRCRPGGLHDLRRTVATGLQRLGVRLEVIEAVLGHVSGSRAGIVGVYQRHRFEAEAREALVAWGAHVQRLLDGESRGAEVVPLRRA